MQTKGNTGVTIRLGDIEALLPMIRTALGDALAVEALSDHKREQERELELIRDHVYEDATSGTEAAGPARERVRDVLRSHGKSHAYTDGLEALATRISDDGLDTMLTEEDVRVLAGAMDRATALNRALLENGLCREVAKLDREIMSGMPLSEDAMRKLVEELARTEQGNAGDHKVIRFPDRRNDHA